MNTLKTCLLTQRSLQKGKYGLRNYVQEDGNEGAGALDAAVGEVEELALWGVGGLGRFLLVGVVSGAREPLRAQTSLEGLCLDGDKEHSEELPPSNDGEQGGLEGISLEF